MNLQEILYKVNITKVVGVTNVEISDIAFDSRKIKDSSLFVAIQGTVSDGHDYIESTIESGVVAVIAEEIPKILNKKVRKRSSLSPQTSNIW